MKKILTLFLVLLMSITAVSAAGMNVVSDTGDEWYDGSDWNPAVIQSWLHPAWISNVNIPGANWIWRTDGVSQSEAVEGSSAGFMKEFFIPECATNIQGSIDITTDNEYALSMNLLGVGNDATWETVETYDVSSYLTTGNNLMQIIAVNEPMEGGTPEKNPAGVIYLLDITYDGCEQEIPEFSVIGAMLVLGIAGIFIAKKRE